MLTHWCEYRDTNNQIENFAKYFMKQWLNPKRMGWFDNYCDQWNKLEKKHKIIQTS